MRPPARTLPLVGLAALLACSGAGGGSGEIDTALLTRAGGDVMLEGGGRLAYEITSERYRQWETARRALRAQRLGLTLNIDPLRVSEAEIQRAVTYFERNGRARRVIEGAGLTVRDYVLTTIAVEQQMAVASGRTGGRDRPAAPPPSAPDSMVRDTAPAPRPTVDTVPVVDTVVVPVDPDPVPPPDTTTAGRRVAP